MTTRDTTNLGKKKSTPNQEESGLLLKWLESATNLVVNLSLGRFLEKLNAYWLDIYFVIWFAFQVAILIFLAITKVENPFKMILMGLFSYRLLEIAVSMFDSVFISVMQRKRHRSVPRLFSLVIVSYIEVIFIFGIIFNFLMDHPSILNTLNTSASLATLAGFSFNQPNDAIFAASISEMLLGIFFVTGVIAAIASYLGAKE